MLSVDGGSVVRGHARAGCCIRWGGGNGGELERVVEAGEAEPLEAGRRTPGANVSRFGVSRPLRGDIIADLCGDSKDRDEMADRMFRPPLPLGLVQVDAGVAGVGACCCNPDVCCALCALGGPPRPAGTTPSTSCFGGPIGFSALSITQPKAAMTPMMADSRTIRMTQKGKLMWGRCW